MVSCKVIASMLYTGDPDVAVEYDKMVSFVEVPRVKELIAPLTDNPGLTFKVRQLVWEIESVVIRINLIERPEFLDKTTEDRADIESTYLSDWNGILE